MGAELKEEDGVTMGEEGSNRGRSGEGLRGRMAEDRGENGGGWGRSSKLERGQTDYKSHSCHSQQRDAHSKMRATCSEAPIGNKGMDKG